MIDFLKGVMVLDNSIFATEKIGKLLFRFSVPCITSLLISALYNIIDQIFVGNAVGYLGNAATGVVFPILLITMAFSWAYGDGTAAYMSLCQGRKEKNTTKAVGTMVTMTFVTSLVLIAVLFILEEPLLSLFGATYDTYDESGQLIVGSMAMAKDYYKIVVGALVPYMMTNAVSSIIRADGSPMYAMIATLSGAITNIALDAIFIMGLGYGVVGAAYATIIGQFISFVFVVVYLVFKGKTFKLRPKDLIPNFYDFKESLLLGISTFITQITIFVLILVSNMTLKKYGMMDPSIDYDANIPISAVSIQSKVFTVLINIVVGIILGAQPIIGYNYGAKNYGRVKKTFFLVNISTIVISLLATLFVELFPGAFVKMFGTEGFNSELYYEFAKMTFRILLMFVTFTMVVKVSSIFFQAVGRPVSAMISSLIRDVLIFIPLTLILPRFMGIKGALWAAPISDLASIVIVAVITIKFFHELKKEENKQVMSDKNEEVNTDQEG